MKFNFTYLLIFFSAIASWSQTLVSASQTFTYCYGNYEDTFLVYQSVNGSPMTLSFNSGEMESNYDFISIIDGNTTGDYLLQDYSGEMGGITLTAISGYITIKINTDVSVSCESESMSELNYTITPFSCNVPQITLSSVANCQSSSLNDSSVSLQVTSMEGNESFTVNVLGQSQTITSAGTYVFNNLPENESFNFTFNISSSCVFNRSIFINCLSSCDTAEQITVGNNPDDFMIYDSNVFGYNNENDDYCGGDKGIWYTLVVPSGLTSLTVAQFELVDEDDAITDGYLSIYRGDCSNLTLIDCMDDYYYEDYDNNTFDYSSFPTIELNNLTPGETLYIFASAYSANQGGFGITAWNPTLSNTDFTSNQLIKLYPNPVQNSLNLETDLDIRKVEVFNLLGQLILSGYNTKQLEVGSLTVGTYIIKMDTNKGVHTQKFIKK